MKEDIRYYARTLGGRQRLNVTTDEEAIRLVETDAFYRATTKEVVKEVRTTIFTAEPSGVLR
ncbi:hypothetical protein JYP52_01580 [Nitratireductor aquibiodomus]|uniref:hypothetical protein n=1 Tax=Nitratireductor aquibiodomus TaxID=204799 RepID=UPI0019D3A16E|nr:hypothetical protein [Nitratireductor aquibiodomus]MBN7759814.1 hypothetical protein [Nitratireductor aquibiodomus]